MIKSDPLPFFFTFLCCALLCFLQTTTQAVTTSTTAAASTCDSSCLVCAAGQVDPNAGDNFFRCASRGNLPERDADLTNKGNCATSGPAQGLRQCKQLTDGCLAEAQPGGQCDKFILAESSQRCCL